jgi:hypothetical protein
MRIDELIPPNSPKRNTAPQPGAAKELKPGSIGRVNNITYKYYDGKGWLDQNGLPARGIANRVLMKQYGRDDSGQPLAPSIGQKISAKLGGPFGQGTDPKANLFTKAMGKIGSALGRGAAALIRPKQEPVPADADGDGQPDAQAPAPAQAQPQAPKMGSGDTRQSAIQVDQDLGNIVNQMRAYQPKPQAKPLPTKFVQGLENDMKNMRTNKDWAVMTGNKILKYAGMGYNVDALQKKWAQEYAVGSKQKIMQDQFSEELDILKKLAGI